MALADALAAVGMFLQLEVVAADMWPAAVCRALARNAVGLLVMWVLETRGRLTFMNSVAGKSA